MEQLINEIRPVYTDRIINQKLQSPHLVLTKPVSHHFNQSEEYFIEVPEPFTIPRFPIHHDVRIPVPEPQYLQALRTYIDELLPHCPDYFSDLTYFFDPAEIHKPCFYRLYKIGEFYYLYLLRITLQYRPLEAELIERGTNDFTAVYTTNRLYFESDCIPLESIETDKGACTAFKIRQTISQTWIGETGKGYLVRGIWTDSELTKFFTKLFLQDGQRLYPYYPFTCKYKTLCMTILGPSPDQRRKLLPYLQSTFQFLEPYMDKIQQSLKTAAFSEQNPLFRELKQKVNSTLQRPWSHIIVTPYLNRQEQKEFHVEFQF
ncbi:MAG: hypothetical protein SNJ56_03225 [Termitinemataceae bacterium]